MHPDYSEGLTRLEQAVAVLGFSSQIDSDSQWIQLFRG
jgi:hypothetical protein